MKSIRIPLAAVNPVLVVRYVSKGAPVANAPASPQNPPNAQSSSMSQARILRWSDVNTPWLQPYFAERQLSDEGHLEFEITLRKESGLVRAQAHIRQLPELECVRSLTLHRTLVESEQTAFFAPETPTADPQESTVSLRGERELSEADLTSYEFDGTHVELDAFLLDVLETSLPTFPLCRPDCLGLCPECGETLNDRGSCAKKGPGATCERFPTEVL
ncbi:MAG: DUF177 domain-containing protein [Silvanigrellales bacterium]|jgi:uncharacterized protein|nr:DUF177 domain-containing protein [Silvanigrellales bacterium]